MKRVFFFGNGQAEGAGLGKERLGGKGAGLARMAQAGLSRGCQHQSPLTRAAVDRQASRGHSPVPARCGFP